MSGKFSFHFNTPEQLRADLQHMQSFIEQYTREGDAITMTGDSQYVQAGKHYVVINGVTVLVGPVDHIHRVDFEGVQIWPDAFTE